MVSRCVFLKYILIVSAEIHTGRLNTKIQIIMRPSEVSVATSTYTDVKGGHLCRLSHPNLFIVHAEFLLRLIVHLVPFSQEPRPPSDPEPVESYPDLHSYLLRS